MSPSRVFSAAMRRALRRTSIQSKRFPTSEVILSSEDVENTRSLGKCKPFVEWQASSPDSLQRLLGGSALVLGAAILGKFGVQPAKCDSEKAPEDTQSPFVYSELQEGIARRLESQERLKAYMQTAQRELEAIYSRFDAMGGKHRPEAVHWLERRLGAFRDEVDQETQIILYGVRERGARARYMAKYGCAAWSEEAIRAVAGFSPLIEIGAGKGQWQAELSRRGADIIAFDNGAAVPCPELPAVGEVRHGDHRELRRHRGRTLLLCYPEGEMAEQCLELYGGEWLLYVGEGRGGVNATDEFFRRLEAEWVCEQVIQLQPFPGNFERLFVLRRRNRQRPPGWGWWGAGTSR